MNTLKLLIEKKNVEQYKESLYQLSFENLTYEENNELLIQLLEMIQKSDFKEGLKTTLHFWGAMEIGFDDFIGEIYPIIPTLFLDQIPFHLLYYIMNTLSDVVSVEEVAIDLFQKGEGEDLKIALKNLFDMLGMPSGTTYRSLWDEANNSGNEVAIEFMSGLQSKYTERVDKPSYVLENEDKMAEKDLLMIADDIVSEISTLDTMDQCVDLLMGGLVNQGIDLLEPSKVRELLVHKLSHMNPEERMKYLAAFLIEKIRENDSLFHILGPVNYQEQELQDGQKSQPSSRCKKYGCRMLYCDCFEFHLTDPDNDDSNEDDSNDKKGNDPEVDRPPIIPGWFKGQCEKCNRKIPKRCYAVRCPLENGGWIGTYCSWNCLYLSGNGGETSERWLALFEKEMNEKKIIDREEM
jgi:hypothetical protein